MTRRSYVQINGQLIDKADLDKPADAGFFVRGDLEPYQSMATGEMIAGRRQHREHLRQHGLIEIGNEVQKPTAPTHAPGLKESIAREVYRKLRY